MSMTDTFTEKDQELALLREQLFECAYAAAEARERTTIYYGVVTGGRSTPLVCSLEMDQRGERQLVPGVEPWPSPNEPTWGYAGVGPGVTARAILMDAAGDGLLRGKATDQEIHRFKVEVIAELRKDEPWRMHRADVVRWLDGIRGNLREQREIDYRIHVEQRLEEPPW